MRHQPGRSVFPEDTAPPAEPRGESQANVTLYRITLSRLRWDDRTRAYLQRRLAEGKTRREIISCLKRYAAREIYRLIVPAIPPAGQTGAAGSLC